MSDQEEENIAFEKEADIVHLKQRKSRSKAVFTRFRNQFEELIGEETDSDVLKKQHERLNTAMDEAQSVMHELVDHFQSLKRLDETHKIIKELEIMEEQFQETTELYRKNRLAQSMKYSVSASPMTSTPDHTSKIDIGKDMWKQLKRVSIPVFDGETKNYESWKAAFYSCIDSAPATDEYKLLQLRQYLSGRALRSIEDLGHSSVAYKAAKERLERKFGGERRKVTRYLDELEKFPTLKEETAASLERFADLLDVAIINLQEMGKYEDLRDGILYLRLQKKMTESMLTRYRRWISENEETESVAALHKWVNRESMYFTAAAETIHGFSRPQKQRTFYAAPVQNSYKQCTLCKDNSHNLWDCQQFKMLTPQERWNKAKILKVCFRCLKSNHIGSKCRNFRQCGVDNCTKLHHKLLHNNQQQQLNPEAQPFDVTAHSDSNSSTYVALRTVPVVLRNGHRSVKVTALLDDASTKTYISSNVAAQMNLNGTQQKMTVKVLNNKIETFDSLSVDCTLESFDGTFAKEIQAQTVKCITGKVSIIDWTQEKTKFSHLKDIKFPEVTKKTTIDMLIGLDNSDIHVSQQEVVGNPGEPVARLTPLGWTCVGKVDNAEQDSSYLTLFTRDEMGLENTLNKFWEIEHVSENTKEMSFNEKAALLDVEKSLKVKSNFYEVCLPWKDNKEKLRSNYSSAVQRLMNTEKRLQKNSDVREAYSETLKGYAEKGYIKKVHVQEEEKSRWYLPHFPVIKPEKETTKIRIVFDASARHNGMSLNDAIHQGPKLQRDLLDVLMRFRKHSVAVVCDVAEMYLRVGINVEDQPFVRFLWRESPEKPIETYQFTRLVFGVNASPFLAQFVSQQNAVCYAEIFPLAAETVTKSTYMDDSMDSVETTGKGIELYQQLNELWNKASMHVRKWLSNSTEVLQEIPQKDRASQIDLSNSELPNVKTLGILWIAKEDQFSFQYKAPDSEMKMTKRNFLKTIASVFDPLGFVAPFIMKAKMVMQNIWLSGIEWDEHVTNDTARDIIAWFDELSLIHRIKLPRCLQAENREGELREMVLHTFVDVSTTAYGAVTYMRSLYDDGTVTIRFVAAKGKIAPLESVSIPRLELLGAVIGLKLTESVAKALDMKLDSVTFWSDSMNVLYWVRNRSKQMKTFVANRVSQIQSATSPQQWRYIPTEDNPADIVSRGASVTELSTNELWWQGPNFLMQDESKWPENRVEMKPEAKSEMKKQLTLCIVNSHKEGSEWGLNPMRFSQWTRLVRVLAWVTRFIENCRSKEKDRVMGALTVDEIEDSEKVIIRNAQKENFKEEYGCLTKNRELKKQSKLTPLNPKMDADDIMRSDGRLVYAEYLSYNTRYPIIMPRKSPVTNLLVKHFHDNANHCGTNQTLSALSAKYWVIAAREVIREVEKSCMECRLRKARVGKQIMAPLPSIRTAAPMRAFAHTAVDFAGPFVTVQGRGKRREKRYLCLFTCLATRAVHLEMAYGLDTSSFLNAFFRMANRRGLPTKMLSDNGTNFIGADKELKELVRQLVTDKENIVESTANKGIVWQFNPPVAPHWGGVHESLIKTAKRAIYAILKQADVTDEELSTAFSGAEGLMNSRPLTYQSSNPADCTPLTPNHFLFGQVGGQFAPETVDETPYNPVKRWRRVQELVSHFWKRWLREWLPTLNSRRKWTHESKNLQEGDIVLVINPEVPRGSWPLGRVIKVFSGRDSHVRAASVLVGNKEITRPIVKLCPLEIRIDTVIGECTTIPADVVFVLDSSISQTSKQFQKQLDFINTFTEHVNISNENFQIGVITFSTTAQVDIDINLNLSKEALQNAVKNIQFRPGTTYTELGLSEARKLLNGRGERISKDGFKMPTMKYVFVLTDGMSTFRAKTRQEAVLLKQDVDKVVVIGIGHQVSHRELIDIASPSDKQSLGYIFSVDDFNALNTVIGELVNVTCERCNISSQSDIVFLLDKSTSITTTEFHLALNDITYIIQNLPDLGNNEGQNIAMVTFDEELQTHFKLDDGQTKDDLLPPLQRITRTEGHCDRTENSVSCSGINITQAIIETYETKFAAENGGRDKARKFLVALTNGDFPDIKLVKSIMENFNKDSNVKLSVIGLGESVNMEGLLSLVNDPNHVYLTLNDDEQEQANLKVLMSDFKFNICNMTET